MSIAIQEYLKGTMAFNREVTQGREINDDVVKVGFHMFQSINNTLLDAYVKCGSLFDTNYVFDKLSAQCIVSWTAIIAD